MKPTLLFLSFLFMVFSVSAQKSEEFYKMAQQKFDQEKYLDANTLIEKAIEKDKKDYRNYMLKAVINLNLKHPKEAMLSAFSAIESAPDKSEPYTLAGRLYNTYGFEDSAIVMYNRAIKRSENDSIKYENYLGRSSAYRDKRDFKSARKDLEFVLQAHPENLPALNNLAIIYANQKQPLIAITYLEKVAALDSSVIWPFINLGLYHTETGNYAAALANFDYALTISNSEPLIYSNRGNLYYKLGDYTNAIKDLNKSIEKYPTNSYAFRNRALVYIAMNKKEEACRDLSAALYNGFTKQYGDEVKKLTRKYCR